MDLSPSLASWTCCPICRGDVEPAISEPGAHPHLRCIGDCGREWWANPKPTASVCAEDADGRLLLVRRGIEPFHGCWDTPGGFIEEGEEASDAALRELREETGLEGRIVGLIGVWGDVYGDTHASTMNVFYRVIVDDSSSGAAASDVTSLGWFDADDLPARNDIAFECVPKAIDVWRHQHEARTKWSSLSS